MCQLLSMSNSYTVIVFTFVELELLIAQPSMSILVFFYISFFTIWHLGFLCSYVCIVIVRSFKQIFVFLFFISASLFSGNTFRKSYEC